MIEPEAATDHVEVDGVRVLSFAFSDTRSGAVADEFMIGNVPAHRSRRARIARRGEGAQTGARRPQFDLARHRADGRRNDRWFQVVRAPAELTPGESSLVGAYEDLYELLGRVDDAGR